MTIPKKNFRCSFFTTGGPQAAWHCVFDLKSQPWKPATDWADKTASIVLEQKDAPRLLASVRESELCLNLRPDEMITRHFSPDFPRRIFEKAPQALAA